MSQTTIIYPGTFDPITNGHVDIVVRAAKLFNKVIVAVAQNLKKSSILNYEERIALTKTVLTQYDNVEVCGFSGLLIDLAREKNTFVILRGLRAISDFEYEFQLAGMNRHLEQRIETVFLTPSEQYSYITSSLIREIAFLGGDVSQFVPPAVHTMLEKLRRQ